MNNIYSEFVGSVQGITYKNRMYKLNIVVPFKNVEQPKFGEFLIVRETDTKGIVLRVVSCVPSGTLKSSSGDEYQAALIVRNLEVSDTIKEDHLWYLYECLVLGTISVDNSQYKYKPGLRSVPHLGLRVCRADDELLKFLANIDTELDDPVIGQLSLGADIAFLSDSKSTVPVRFNLKRLISKRTFVFSRAGYGKSNFVKLLITRLREQLREEGEKCGLLIFDPEGEYAFETKTGLPGFADLEPFLNGLVVFTNRNVKDEFYKKFIGGSIKIDLRVLDPREVADILFASPDTDAQWRNIMIAFGGKNQKHWRTIIDEISHNETVEFDSYKSKIPTLEAFGANSFNAFLRRLQKTVNQLHSSESSFLDQVMYHLKKGNTVIVDISILSDMISGHIIELTLKKIFEFNQEKYMLESEGDMIRTVIVVEEAQNSLGAARSDDLSPVIRWAKEGRKYNLGGIYITQQPSAIAKELLSQGDNFFAMHLINNADLDSLNKVNAHFTEDILTYIMNEPIIGNAYFWSAPYQPYVLNVKIDQYEKHAKVLNSGDKSKLLKSSNGEYFATDKFKKLQTEVSQEFIKRLRQGQGIYKVVDAENALHEYTSGKKVLAIHPFFARHVLGQILKEFKDFDDLLTVENGKLVATESMVIHIFDSIQWIVDKRVVRLKHYGGKKAGWIDDFLLLDQENFKSEQSIKGTVIPVEESPSLSEVNKTKKKKK